ncbi:MAG: hypothetical protein QNK11_06305 [Legionella sp.]|nr:hypothetical protein [Legionella sp.]
MPLPLIALGYVTATSTITTVTTAGAGIAAFRPPDFTFASIGDAIWGVFGFSADLPSFDEEVKNVSDKVHTAVDELVHATDEHLNQDKKQSLKEAKRMDEVLTRFDSGLTAMEGSTTTLGSKIVSGIDLQKPDTGALDALKAAQNDLQSGIALQQSDMKRIAESLKNLPDLLQARQEAQALQVENGRLRLEKAGYASRLEKLLAVSKAKGVENEALKVEVSHLKGRVSEYASRIKTMLAFSKEKQLEVDALRQKTNPDTSGSQFKLTLFPS